VAEFVEDEATLEMLKGFGIDLVQGYCLDMPQAQHPAVILPPPLHVDNVIQLRSDRA